jgi:hypothetical protein
VGLLRRMIHASPFDIIDRKSLANSQSSSGRLIKADGALVQAIRERANMSQAPQPQREMPDVSDPEAYRKQAFVHMQAAIKFLDQADGHSYAAAHLQHAIDLLLKELPHLNDDPD